MFTPYDYTSAEAKWQKQWKDKKVYSANLKTAKNPYYSLVMFPYPSGDKLHVGHWFNYGIADTFARFKRLQGHEVFSPMGFDAFGLPAENYAIKTGTPPAQSTAKNVEKMIDQFNHIGCMYDWDKMVNTTDPTYYRWTQWLFLEMFKNGLAYKKLGNVNWCPKDQTVLANEQAQDGKCERCGSDVVQKPLEQWYWSITKYSQKLLDGLNDLEWPEKTKIMQRNWIGRSEGAHIDFEIEGSKEKITVFTTRPDTLFGATYIVLAPEHPLVDSITEKKFAKKIESYKQEVKKKTEIERTDLNVNKTGEFTGAYALHPVTGDKLPIWIADYVLANYGTGSVMAVPGHDERDFDFAEPREELRSLIKPVIQPDKSVVNFSMYVHKAYAAMTVGKGDLEVAMKNRDEEDYKLILQGKKCWTGQGKMINSDFLNDLPNEEAKEKMIQWLEKNKKGKKVINYRLRDWLVSRQRYWGAPIPIVYDPQGKAHPVPAEHLPWLLPTDVEFKPTGESPLKHSKEFKARTEKIFGKGWTPEYDTMDTFVCSSFYYLRYLAEGDSKKLIDKDIEKKWMPVSMYIGGAEHACMHLIYARFVMMALKDFGYVSHAEPFQRLVHQGTVTNKGAKMSKSKGNVVSPDGFVEQYGSDVFRMYLMFMGPFEAGGDWSDTGINGIVRFVQRVWKILSEKASAKVLKDKPEVMAALHKTIKKVTDDIQAMHFNTAISALMQLMNTVEKEESLSEDFAKTLAILLAPLAPHMAEELWSKFGGKGFVIEQKWPAFDASLTVESTITVVVQVNGKVRGDLTVPKDTAKEEILKQAKELENVKKYLIGAIKKEIYVPGKLVSLVV